jgi:diacylglycerol kinase family enzyme
VNALIIYNPAAGNGRGDALARVARRRLEAEQWHVTVIESRPPAQNDDTSGAALIDLARAARVVLIVGGDGTVREVLKLLAPLRDRPPIALVPAGNANVLAREYGIPLQAEAAAALVLHGEIMAVDCGVANDELFVAMAGIGYDALAVRWLHRLRRTRLGAWVYRLPGGADAVYALVGAAALFRLTPVRVCVASDDAKERAGIASISILNTARYAKHWSLAPEACAHDGWLDTRSERGALFLRPLLAIIAGMRRRHAPACVARYGRVRHLSIRARNSFAWQLDGEPMAPVRGLEIGLRPGFFRLVVPAQAVAT